MIPKTATHKAKGKYRDFYYRQLQVAIKVNRRRIEWEYYCSYQSKWLISERPHCEIIRL